MGVASVTFGDLKSELGIILHDEEEETYTPTIKGLGLRLSLEHIEAWFTYWNAKPIVTKVTTLTVTGQDTYPLPEGTELIEKVTMTGAGNTSEEQIYPIYFNAAERYDAPTFQSNPGPRVYYRQGTDIVLVPPPRGGGEQLHIYSNQLAVDPDDDSTEMRAAPWLRAMVLYQAASQCADMKGDYPAAQAFDKRFRLYEREKELQLAKSQRQDGEAVTSSGNFQVLFTVA